VGDPLVSLILLMLLLLLLLLLVVLVLVMPLLLLLLMLMLMLMLLLLLLLLLVVVRIILVRLVFVLERVIEGLRVVAAGGVSSVSGRQPVPSVTPLSFCQGDRKVLVP
jgi:hypothetical protein